MATIYANFLQGTLSSAINNTDVTLVSSEFISLPAVANGDVLWIVLDPAASAGAPEAVLVTSHVAATNSVVVVRGQQGSVARSHGINIPWSHALTKTDIDSFNIRPNINYIMNGDFRVNQRGATSTSTDGVYLADRWESVIAGPGTTTMSMVSFTAGDGPTSTHQPATALRLVTASQTTTSVGGVIQYLEDVRALAGKTITISFWAKAASGTPTVSASMFQYFGTGGTPSANVAVSNSYVTLSTTWQRYSVTTTMPSLSGKTIGTTRNSSASYLMLFVSHGSLMGLQNNTFDFWGIQLEEGSVATPFEYRPIQQELAMCQRYYYRINAEQQYQRYAYVQAFSTTKSYGPVILPVPMRVPPTSVTWTGLAVFTAPGGTSSAITGLVIDSLANSTVQPNLDLTYTALGAAGNVYQLVANNTTVSHLAFSADF